MSDRFTVTLRVTVQRIGRAGISRDTPSRPGTHV
jgi:hypothetical protein